MIINADIITLLFLGMLILSSILVVITEKLLNAVIYLGVFSTIIALVFLLIGAPDVALAEVIIGSTLSTIIYLIAIKKFRIFTIYLINNDKYDTERKAYTDDLLKQIDIYLKSKEMQLHAIHTFETLDKLSIREDYSLIIESVKGAILLHSNTFSHHNDEIREIIKKLNYPVKVKLSNDIMDLEMPYSEEDESIEKA